MISICSYNNHGSSRSRLKVNKYSITGRRTKRESEALTEERENIALVKMNYTQNLLSWEERGEKMPRSRLIWGLKPLKTAAGRQRGGGWGERVGELRRVECRREKGTEWSSSSSSGWRRRRRIVGRIVGRRDWVEGCEVLQWVWRQWEDKELETKWH